MPFENALYTDIYIPEFEKKYPNIEVEFLHFDDLRQRYVTLGSARDLPDVMRQSAPDVQEYIARNMNIPLDDYIERDQFDMSDFPEEIWAGTQKDGVTYGIPQDANVPGLYYDPAAFKEAGLQEPDHNYTLEQMKEDAHTLTQFNERGNVERYGIVMGWDASIFQALS